MKPLQAAQALRTIADKLDRSKNPDRKLVIAAVKRVLTAVDGSEADHGSKWGNTPEIEEALYGHSGGEQDPDAQGSSIWWLVFNEIGMEDWTPVTNYDAVANKAKELLSEWSKNWGSKAEPESDPAAQAKSNQERITRALGQLKKNWEEYQKSYMPEHVKILKEKGLM